MHYFTAYNHLFITQTVYSEHVEKPPAWMFDFLRHKKKTKKLWHYLCFFSFSWATTNSHKTHICTRCQRAFLRKILIFNKEHLETVTFYFSLKNSVFFAAKNILFHASMNFFFLNDDNRKKVSNVFAVVSLRLVADSFQCSVHFVLVKQKFKSHILIMFFVLNFEDFYFYSLYSSSSLNSLHWFVKILSSFLQITNRRNWKQNFLF